MLFSVLAVLSLCLTALARDIVVTVGGNTTDDAGAVYQPQSVIAEQGDRVIFNCASFLVAPYHVVGLIKNFDESHTGKPLCHTGIVRLSMHSSSFDRPHNQWVRFWVP